MLEFTRFCTLFEVWIQYQIRVKFSNDASVVARLNVFSFQSSCVSFAIHTR